VRRCAPASRGIDTSKTFDSAVRQSIPSHVADKGFELPEQGAACRNVSAPRVLNANYGEPRLPVQRIPQLQPLNSKRRFDCFDCHPDEARSDG